MSMPPSASFQDGKGERILAQATEPTLDIQLVTFFLGREEYAVDVMAVREIISMTAITKTAKPLPHVEGVINLRGSIVPVISLQKRLGISVGPETIYACIAIMDFAGELTGFIIDDVSDVIRVKRSDISPPLNEVGAPWIEGILVMDTKMVIVMNLKHIA
jgi:purine-binding chemotaxis protein CheW